MAYNIWLIFSVALANCGYLRAEIYEKKGKKNFISWSGTCK